jgi:YARHG domain
VLILGIGFVFLVVLGLSGVYVYKRSRAPAAVASPTPASPTVSERAKQVEAKILRGETLNENDIAGLSPYELRILRNVHFARYGRKYDQGGELGSYFYTRPWYKPSDTYNDNLINATDKANVNLLVASEKQINSSTSVSNTASSDSTTNANTSYQSTNATNATSNSPADKLTNANVEAAVRQMLSNLSQGGSVSVQGVQELPQENAAVADLIFSQFKYAADPMGGTPVAANQYHPKPLPRDRIPTPEEMFQPRLTTYSGNGKATLKHYNNGQWTLKQIVWGSMGVGWQGNVVVR